MATRLTKEQRIAAIKHYYQSGENGAETSRLANQFDIPPPQRQNITCFVRKFEETESVADIQRSGTPSTATTLKTAPTTSHLNVVVQSPSLHWGGSKWLVNSPRVSSSGDSPLDNSSHFLSLLSNARSHVDSTLKPN